MEGKKQKVTYTVVSIVVVCLPTMVEFVVLLRLNMEIYIIVSVTDNYLEINFPFKNPGSIQYMTTTHLLVAC